jgi:hypothetical protein
LDEQTLGAERWKIWGDILGRAEALPNVSERDSRRGHAFWYDRALEAVGEANRMLAWGTMIYACGGKRPGPGGNGCGWEHRVWLGVGCEGPKNLKDHGVTVPVPFMCGTCPECGGQLHHDRWNEDEDFKELRLIPEDAARFFLPDEDGIKASIQSNYGGADYEDPQGLTTRHR